MLMVTAYPYEITRCTKLDQSSVSTRALYGNYKFRPPFLRLETPLSRDADDELGSSVQFTIRAAGATFEVAGVDTGDGEALSISNVRWDARILSFDSTVQSAGHQVQYVFAVISPSEVLVRYTTSERWVRVDTTA
jgi:hypothetical protein